MKKIKVLLFGIGISLILFSITSCQQQGDKSQQYRQCVSDYNACFNKCNSDWQKAEAENTLNWNKYNDMAKECISLTDPVAKLNCLDSAIAGLERSHKKYDDDSKIHDKCLADCKSQYDACMQNIK